MKAYGIKNKDRKMLCWHHIAGYYFDHFNIKSLVYMEIGTKKEIKTLFNNKEFDNTDYSIVPITIAEGDLEEELETTRAALFNCCERLLQHIQPTHSGLEFVEALYSSFIKQAKEKKDE